MHFIVYHVLPFYQTGNPSFPLRGLFPLQKALFPLRDFFRFRVLFRVPQEFSTIREMYFHVFPPSQRILHLEKSRAENYILRFRYFSHFIPKSNFSRCEGVFFRFRAGCDKAAASKNSSFYQMPKYVFSFGTKTTIKKSSKQTASTRRVASK